MQLHSVGIDLGKTAFHLVALSAAGTVLLKKKFTRSSSSRSRPTCRPRWPLPHLLHAETAGQ